MVLRFRRKRYDCEQTHCGFAELGNSPYKRISSISKDFNKTGKLTDPLCIPFPYFERMFFILDFNRGFSFRIN